MKLIDCSHSMQPYYRCRDYNHAGVKCHARTGEMANWVHRIHVPLQVENEHYRILSLEGPVENPQLLFLPPSLLSSLRESIDSILPPRDWKRPI